MLDIINFDLGKLLNWLYIWILIITISYIKAIYLVLCLTLISVIFVGIIKKGSKKESVNDLYQGYVVHYCKWLKCFPLEKFVLTKLYLFYVLWCCLLDTSKFVLCPMYFKHFVTIVAFLSLRIYNNIFETFCFLNINKHYVPTKIFYYLSMVECLWYIILNVVYKLCKYQNTFFN